MKRLLAGVASAVLISGCATPFDRSVAAQTAPQTTPMATAGYLSANQVEALSRTVPAPSPEGSAETLADRARSDRYRALEGSDRWLLATAHAELSPALARQHFDCALGVRFAEAETPRLTAIFDKLLKDANGAAELAKARAFRPRPVGVDISRPACQRVSEAGRASASYPSGSATVGSAYGQAMAALDPGRAAQAREIGHQIGVSRAVCGMHYPADVAAGEALGQAVFAEVAATPAFQADLEAARAELAAVRATGLTNPGCVAEAAALAAPLP